MTEKLFTDFPPVSTQQWEEQILRDLKGADYEKKLVWKTLDGFKVRPYYRQEDLKHIPYLDTLPGVEPFLRGTRENNDWLIRQSFPVDGSLREVNARVLAALDRGVESIGFRLDAQQHLTLPEMEALLSGIVLSAVEISFEGISSDSPGILTTFLDYVRSAGTPPEQVRARFAFDPLGDALLHDGSFSGKEAEVLKALVEACSQYPQIRVIAVSGYKIQNMGAGIVQELACSMAMGSHYYHVLTDKGVPPGLAARAIHFHMGIGSHYFLEIAKFRAARIFWHSIAEAPMSVHATTSSWNQTAYDMYVNLLRGTTEAMSAAVAGVDSMEVLPFDRVVADGSGHSYRLARNIQIILKEEARFNQVTDPAAGSYYVENLTHSILSESQKFAGQLQQQGGVSTLQGAAWILESVRQTRERRLQNLATRKEVLVGINQYPDQGAKAPQGFDPRGEAPGMRAAGIFESLRLRTENALNIPSVFLLTFGNLSMCRARAQFASNFFGVGGFRIIDNNHFATPEEGTQAANSSGARIVVACSSDEEYETAVPLIAASLNKGVILTVAGDPPCKDILISQGTDHFISLRSNLPETLIQYQNELGL